MTAPLVTAELRRLLAEALEARPNPWPWRDGMFGNEPPDWVEQQLIIAVVNALPALLDRLEDLELLANEVRLIRDNYGVPAAVETALTRLDSQETPDAEEAELRREADMPC